MSEPEVFYQRLSDTRFRSTRWTQGAWAEHEQHMSPVSALLVHALDRHDPRPDLQPARVTFDILGQIPQGELEITTRTVRPGRTIELVQADFVVDGRPRVVATMWRHLVGDTSSVAGVEDPDLPGPDQAEVPPPTPWPGGYISSLEFRTLGLPRPGRARAWLRTRIRLLEDEPVSDLARHFCHVDTANGLAPRIGPDRGRYPNTDLTVHLFRLPVGEWTGFDVSATYGTTGVGLTSAVLHDELGPFGRSAQALTVRLR